MSPPLRSTSIRRGKMACVATPSNLLAPRRPLDDWPTANAMEAVTTVAQPSPPPPPQQQQQQQLAGRPRAASDTDLQIAMLGRQQSVDSFFAAEAEVYVNCTRSRGSGKCSSSVRASITCDTNDDDDGRVRHHARGSSSRSPPNRMPRTIDEEVEPAAGGLDTLLGDSSTAVAVLQQGWVPIARKITRGVRTVSLDAGMAEYERGGRLTPTARFRSRRGSHERQIAARSDSRERTRSSTSSCSEDDEAATTGGPEEEDGDGEDEAAEQPPPPPPPPPSPPHNVPPPWEAERAVDSV